MDVYGILMDLFIRFWQGRGQQHVCSTSIGAHTGVTFGCASDDGFQDGLGR